MQSCPKTAQVGGVPASVANASLGTPVSGLGPASGCGGGGGALHVPRVLPGGNWQRPPGQQSAFVVHEPVAGTQAWS